MKLLIFAILLVSILANFPFKYLEKKFVQEEKENWRVEEFLTGEFKNNLGSHCKLIAKDGVISGVYFTKPSRGELVQPGFPVTGVYSPVKDGVLVTMNVVFKMAEENEDGLENISHATWNGKIYSNKKDFKLNWLLNSNQIEKKEWFSSNVGQDIFTKI